MKNQKVYEPVIGLEVHCQLLTKSKLFCKCSTEFGSAPNSQTCPTCLGYPGTLPTLNEQAVLLALRVAIAINGKIDQSSVFSRKQYFYPDLPKGYQITQYDRPYCQHGELFLSSGKRIGITRIHIEEDAGKLIHAANGSFIDLNRAGTPLVEIVSNPELANAEEAVDYLKRLHSLVKYLGICDGNLEEGSFRCDANVSVRIAGEQKLGVRCEIKNLNSFRNVEKAINYEILRQIDVIEHGGKVVQQTMGFDPATGQTKPQRTKEDSHDYRYFPEPDLQVLVIHDDLIQKVRDTLPELPDQKIKRYKFDYGLTEYDIGVLTESPELSKYFENVLSESQSALPKAIANWITTELFCAIKDRKWDVSNILIRPSHLSELMELIANGTISGKIAKVIFSEMCESFRSPKEIVTEKGMVQISNTTEIAAIINKVIAENPGPVSEFLGGREKVIGFLVGQVMKLSGGKMNPGIVNNLLVEKLGEFKKGGN